jgi:D-glycero-D-manno-heptose 1,7-bisphosphate phosphatase
MLEKYKINTNASTTSLKCVIGLDRDGVINEDLGTYVTHPNQFSPISGSLTAIAELRKKGYQIVIITNQGGIGKGIMTEADVDSVHSYMLELLGNAGCSSIDGIYYSVSSNKKDPYAKPNIGMFKQCESHNKSIRFNKGFYVGDKLSDLKAAIKIGARPVLVRTGHGIETEKELNKYTYKDIKEKTYIFDNLADFAANLE